MSHIQWYYGDNKKGGMWSQDYTTTDKYSTCKEDEVSYDEHIRIATKLISKQKDQIFENAYNIERYFEIRLIESEIDSIDDEILSNSVKKNSGIRKSTSPLTNKSRNILMLQAIKKIIIMTIVNIIFFYSFQSTADEMVLIKNTGLGLREISKEGH